LIGFVKQDQRHVAVWLRRSFGESIPGCRL
jgi:hypothetical protein